MLLRVSLMIPFFYWLLTTDHLSEVKHRDVLHEREKKNLKSKEEWESILTHKLLQQRVSQDLKLERLEVVATISDAQLSIVFRKKIEGIIQRLGDINLRKVKENEEVELDTVSWALTAVQRSDALEEEVQSLTSKYNSQSETIQKLNQQLDDFIIAKREHETLLLQKFMELLNAKKLKIRDQQRLLAAAKIDPQQAAKVQASRSNTKIEARTPEKSREGKRKAVESESEDKGTSFGSKHEIKREDELSETVNTPESSDHDVTEDEGGESDEGIATETKLPDRSKVNDEMQLDTPPPSRELPFGNKDHGMTSTANGTKPADTPQASALNQESGNESDETDDDDEL